VAFPSCNCLGDQSTETFIEPLLVFKLKGGIASVEGEEEEAAALAASMVEN
jgi:hypothetical protein